MLDNCSMSVIALSWKIDITHAAGPMKLQSALISVPLFDSSLRNVADIPEVFPILMSRKSMAPIKTKSSCERPERGGQHL